MGISLVLQVFIHKPNRNLAKLNICLMNTHTGVNWVGTGTKQGMDEGELPQRVAQRQSKVT